MIYIGIDNGVSGSIGIIDTDNNTQVYFPTPTFSQQNYTKTKANITRIDTEQLKELIGQYPLSTVVLERPMVNPARFKATTSALRSLEATLIVVELLGHRLIYVDSKEWQRVLLPEGVKGSADLKKASLDIGLRLFPGLSEPIRKQKDADGILIAEWARRGSL